METPSAETQPGQDTAAPVTADSATATPEPVKAPEPVKSDAGDPKWFVDRIGEVTARYHQERLAREELERKFSETQAKPVEEARSKTLEDFGYDERKYQDYLFGEAEKRAVQAARKAREDEQSQAQRDKRARKFQEREVEFEKANTDYRDIAHRAPINDRVAEILMEMDAGPEVAYFLGKNKSVALSLNDLPPHIAAIELGRIDARLSSERAAKAAALEKARAEKAVTKAPEPSPTIEASGEPSSVKPDEADSDKLSDAEWARRRNKQVSRKGNR